MHVMLDLETWGTRPGCDIRSIGAVTFDPIGGYVWTIDPPSFYIATENPVSDIETNWDGRKYPLHRDPKTIKWWNDQSNEAQAAFENPVDLRGACLKFADWLHYIVKDGPYPSEHIRLWTKGPHFDVSILAEAYHAVGLPVPWHYRSPRDMRTIVEVAGITYQEKKSMFTGTPHYALDDAISQARVVCEAYRRLNRGTA